MTSPYQLSFGYLKPRPLISPDSYIGAFQRVWRNNGDSDKQPHVASADLAAVAACSDKKNKYAHVPRRNTREEIEKYFERKREREELRLKQAKEKENIELAE